MRATVSQSGPLENIISRGPLFRSKLAPNQRYLLLSYPFYNDCQEYTKVNSILTSLDIECQRYGTPKQCEIICWKLAELSLPEEIQQWYAPEVSTCKRLLSNRSNKLKI